MARIDNPRDPNLVVVFTEHGGVAKAFRKSGAVLRRVGDRHAVDGRVKAGLTPRQILDALIGAGKRAELTAAGRAMADTPIVTESARAAADARDTARAAERERQHDIQRRTEALTLGEIAAHDSNAMIPDDETAMTAYASMARRNAHPIDGRLAYVVTMARFHSGVGGVTLHGPVMASFRLPNDYAHKAALDAIAQITARNAFGTDDVAARAWGKALYGS